MRWPKFALTGATGPSRLKEKGAADCGGAAPFARADDGEEGSRLENQPLPKGAVPLKAVLRGEKMRV
jgi:hypothetical protein